MKVEMRMRVAIFIFIILVTGNRTPKRTRFQQNSESPQTPKSDFANFAESILSPSALDTPIVCFSTGGLTPRFNSLSLSSQFLISTRTENGLPLVLIFYKHQNLNVFLSAELILLTTL
jgi:hypothetical protein